ncbi:MAG: glycoside hydrolase family 97 protein [Candidatus Sumerlaeaceae bacterium]
MFDTSGVGFSTAPSSPNFLSKLMRNLTVTSLLYMLLAFAPSTGMANSEPSLALSLDSPDGNIHVRLSAVHPDASFTGPSYAVDYGGKTLIQDSGLSVRITSSTLFSAAMAITRASRVSADTTNTVICGKSATARDHYNELTAELENSSTHETVELVFRAYDDGVAFRYRFPGSGAFAIEDEDTAFCIAGNPTAWTLPVTSFATPYEFYYNPVPLQQITSSTLLGLPLLLKYDDGTCAAITEADLTDYAGMYLSPSAAQVGCLASRLSPRLDDPAHAVKAMLPHQSPWRVIMIGKHEGALIESNLVYNLNPPSLTSNTAWIKTGKTTFPWWNGYELGNAGFKGDLNTATMKHYIDFCSEAGIEYHSLDGVKNKAWYDGKIRPYDGADITTARAGLDLPQVIAYAQSKNVKLRFWMNSDAAKAQMEKAFPIYEKWGIEGVMCDFFDHDDQQTVQLVHDILALALKHHLTVTLHNMYKPTGLQRTYPNLLAVEAVLNLEYNKWTKGVTPEHDVTVPFTRMLAGPMDFHSGSFHNVFEADYKAQDVAPMTRGTRARELARYVVFEDYLPMMADYPAAYRGQPGLQFMVDVPTTWDETRFLNGEVGKYITIARRKGRQWYIGTMTNSESRDLSIPLDFLPAGNYKAEIFGDDLHQPEQATALQILQQTVTRNDSIQARLTHIGGQAVRLSPM